MPSPTAAPSKPATPGAAHQASS